MSCPVCVSSETTKYVFEPYETCIICQHTYQPSPPTKTWMNPGDGNSNGYSGAKMNAGEMSINKSLAQWLYSRYRPGTTIDIGSGYPFLAYCFKQLGADATALDGAFKDDLIDNNLDVDIIALDWENDDVIWTDIDLITMIHVLEHFCDPGAALQKAYNVLSAEGILYIRLPNKDVPGIERDHTDDHVKIHPNIFCTDSLIHLMNKNGFFLIWIEHMRGSGQSSLIFRKRPPKISLSMIVKNEEGNIGKCLDTVRDFCDEMLVLDTGSTDCTVAEAIEHGAIVHHSEKFDKDTKIREFNFSEARNESMQYASGDWIFWMDADDIFVGKPILSPLFDAYDVVVEYGNSELKHARLFRNGWDNGFTFAVHEVPEISQCRRSLMAKEVGKVVHNAEQKTGRCERNISILEKEHESDKRNLRTIFYLANAYIEGGQTHKALVKFREYIRNGGNFHDELVLAHRYLADCYFILGIYDEAIRQSFQGLCVDDRWAEFYCRIGESYFQLKQYKKAIPYFLLADGLPYPNTLMWYRKEMYNSVPKHYLSSCYEMLGDNEKALEYTDDKDRRKHLLNKKFIIEVVRPGALGDIVASTPALERLREKYPDALIRYICHSSGILLLKHNPNIDEISRIELQADLRLYFNYPMNEGYPDVPMRKHLAEHFADSVGVELQDGWRCHLNLLNEPWPDYGSLGINYKKPFITFAIRTGWSRYKEWPIERWEELIKRMTERHDVQFVQVGAADEHEVCGGIYTGGKTDLMGAFSLIQNSILFVGLDSVFNHASNALRIPAVIMFGSTHPTGSGYDDNTNLVSDNCEIQPCYKEDAEISVHKKPPCPYEHKCIKEFMTVDLVESAIFTKLSEMKYTLEL